MSIRDLLNPHILSLEPYQPGKPVEELTEEEIANGLTGAIAAGPFVPVLASAAVHNIGVRPMLDFIVAELPDATAVGPRQVLINGDAGKLDCDPAGPAGGPGGQRRQRARGVGQAGRGVGVEARQPPAAVRDRHGDVGIEAARPKDGRVKGRQPVGSP